MSWRSSDGRERFGWPIFVAQKSLISYLIFPHLQALRLLFRPKSGSNDNVMIFGLVTTLVAAACISFVTAALDSSAATNVVGSPSASSTNNALQRIMPPNENSVHFYLVDTTSNATLFRLHDGEEVDNYFLKGIPVSVRVDVREKTRHILGVRLIYNGGGNLERVITSRPFAFGGTAAVADDGFRLLPLPWLGQFGRHTFTAILVDEQGFDFANQTITISVVPETIPSGHHQLFMDAPERDAFFQRLLQSSGVTGRSSTSSSSNESVVMNNARKNYRIAPLPRRVRLGSLSLKHFLRSRKRKSSR
jgi:hypothetical protein